MKQKVIIIGHGYLSRLALIRSLGLVGYEVSVIVTMYGQLSKKKPLDCYSKYVKNVYYCNAKDEKNLIKLLLEQCAEQSHKKVVIIPDSDYSAAFIDKNKEVLSELFDFPHIYSKDFVVDMMDKERQIKLARRTGLKVPGATTIHVSNGVFPEIEDIVYPCFTKALTTMGGGKQWFKKCNDKAQLVQALESFAKWQNADILIEDYIDIEEEYAVVGLTDGVNVIIPGVIQFVENCQCHLGIARKGKIIPVTGFEDLLEQFKTYVRETHFVGLFDIDFLYSNDNYYFCEMNFRYGGSGYAYTKSGVNLPAMFVQMISGQLDISQVNSRIKTERSYINERMLVDDLAVRNISIREFYEKLNSADIVFVEDSDDPKPKKLFKIMVLKAIIKNIIRKIIRLK